MEYRTPRRLRMLAASAAALAAVALCPAGSEAFAQTVYREYDDGRVEVLPGYGPPVRQFHPTGRPPPRVFSDEDDEDDDDDDRDDGEGSGEEEGGADGQDEERYYPDRRSGLSADRAEPPPKAPTPPPSVDARPDQKAWKPAL